MPFNTLKTPGVQEVCTRTGPIERPLTEQPCSGYILKAQPEERPLTWGNMALSIFILLVLVGAIRAARGDDAKKFIFELNAMFDSVWCPLPTWVHIVLVIMAWALCFRVGKDFVKTWKRDSIPTK